MNESSAMDPPLRPTPMDPVGDRVELASRSESPAIVLAHAAVCSGERPDPHVFAASLSAAVTALRRLPDLAALHGSQPDWRP